MAEVIQGHTIRISKNRNKWLIRCLSCTFNKEADTEIEALTIRGCHFGGLATLEYLKEHLGIFDE